MNKLLPALSHHFHLKPADLDVMTVEELDEYLRALRDIEREQRKAEREAKQTRARRR